MHRFGTVGGFESVKRDERARTVTSCVHWVHFTINEVSVHTLVMTLFMVVVVVLIIIIMIIIIQFSFINVPA